MSQSRKKYTQETYTEELNECHNQSYVMKNLDKGVRVFNMDYMPFLEELLKKGEYMQRARLSIKMTLLSNVPQSPARGGTRKKIKNKKLN